MTRKGTRKGRSVSLPDDWFAAIEAHKRSERKSLEDLGRDLALALGEPVPIPVSTVHDYLRRRRGVTEELTRAFAAATGLPLPPMGSESSDPEIAELAHLAREMKTADPELFRQQLATFRHLAAAVKRHSSR